MDAFLANRPDYGPYVIDASHRWRRATQQTFGNCPWYELLAILSGACTITRGRTPSSHEGPMVLLIPPASALTVRFAPGVEWRHLRFHLFREPDGASASRDARPEAVWGVPLPLHMPPDRVEPCLGMMRFCTTFWWRRPYGWWRANARLGEWMAEYAEHERAATGDGDGHERSAGVEADDPWMARAERIAMEGIRDGITVERWAKVLGMTRQTLAQRLRDHGKRGPRAYLARLRLSHARALLLDPTLAVKQIARACGYESVAAFSRAFHRFAGLSPTQWRETNR